MDDTERFVRLVSESGNIVFFGGAGVSTESGIPDFRSVDGLYSQKYDYPPEQMLSHSFFMAHPDEFYRFYRDKLIVRGVKPNITHIKLAGLERAGKLRAVITQNIDGLHQAAGSKNVLELHGSTKRCYCMRCGRRYGEEALSESEGVPHCECGGIIRPDIVLYEEGLDTALLTSAVRYIRDADMLIVGGTSLAVYPAAGLIDYYRGHKLVLINRDATPLDGRADLVLRQPLGSVFAKIQSGGNE
ncbi:MAG TPA: NAD-dependent protein deacylase [Firmicutes bacterium]|nr:NAD-dependent protein deacylase [Bacillota bacterium]